MPRAPNRSVGLNPVRMWLSDRAPPLEVRRPGPRCLSPCTGRPRAVVAREQARRTVVYRGGVTMVSRGRVRQIQSVSPRWAAADQNRPVAEPVPVLPTRLCDLRWVSQAGRARCFRGVRGAGPCCDRPLCRGGRLVHACRSDERARRQRRAPVATMAHAHSRDSSRRPNPASVPRRMGAGAA